MAETKKTTTSTKKANTAAKKATEINEEVVSAVENKIEEVINNVDTDIKLEEVSIDETIVEELKPIKEVINNINVLEESKKKFDEEISKNPEDAAKLIKEELAAANAMKAEAEKIIRNVTRVNSQKYTHLWNGMNYGD